MPIDPRGKGQIYSLFSLNNQKREMVKFSHPSKAVIYYKSYKQDLLTGIRHPSSLQDFAKELDQYLFNKSYDSPIVFHLSYEWGYSVLDLDPSLIGEDDILAIEIHYTHWRPIHFPSFHSQAHHISLESISGINEKDYNEHFSIGHQELLKGNCYQFNLTYKHNFQFNKNYSCEDFIASVWKDKAKRGAYAHATFIPSIKKLYLSNSPECLFSLSLKKEHFELFTMPIKGSLKLSPDQTLEESWVSLKKSIKDQSELFMITDLLRNDLSKIEKPDVRVLRKKRKILVPEIIHQSSVIKVLLSYNVSLGKILKCLFPGGSITGAPKKNVVKILKNLEREKRGHYTGSTVVLHKDLLAASINIRSAEIDFNDHLLSYGAGGGITLLSKPDQEYLEMKQKVKSFISLFA